MLRVTPIADPAAQEPIAQTFGRIQEMFGEQPIPHPFYLYAHVPAFLQDFYMNFKKFIFQPGKLDLHQKAVIGLAVSLHGKCTPWVDYFQSRLIDQGGSTEQSLEIAALVATNSTYNTFFKFRNLSGTEIFNGMPVALRAHTFHGTSIDEKLIELLNVVISNLNVCQPCTAAHVQKAQSLGVADEAILEAIQCAATMASGISLLGSLTETDATRRL
ncbi:MAG: carboxymuconolactone decarboxylase family protein [Planctomycetaceae bacterium]